MMTMMIEWWWNRVVNKKKYIKYTLDTNFICFLFFSFFFLLQIYLPLFSLYHNELETERKMCIRNKLKWILIIEKKISSFVHWMMKRMKEKMYKTLISSRFINEVKSLLWIVRKNIWWFCVRMLGLKVWKF